MRPHSVVLKFFMNKHNFPEFIGVWRLIVTWQVRGRISFTTFLAIKFTKGRQTYKCSTEHHHITLADTHE